MKDLAHLGALRAFTEDLWLVERDVPDANEFGELEQLVEKVRGRVTEVGYDAVDSSARFDNAVHVLELVEQWAQLAHDARHSNRLHVIVRTPQNSGPLLVQQRIEALHAGCWPNSPVAIFALAHEQVLVLTNQHLSELDVCAELVRFVATCKDLASFEETGAQPEARAANTMPEEVFAQQQAHISSMMSTLNIDTAKTEPLVEDITPKPA